MNQGVYIALSGAKLQELRLEILANNLANTSTSGYKKDKITSRSFVFELERAFAVADVSEDMGSPLIAYSGVYSKTQHVGTDFSQGYLKFTGNPLNISLEGPGFIAVETPGGVRYTRQGVYDLNSKGEIVTSDGYLVRGKGLSGLEKGELTIDAEGSVYVDGERKGNIDIVEFENPHILRKEGNNLFVLKQEGKFEKEPENTVVKQGFLEMANINIVNEMVNLIELNRMYEAYQKIIQSMDESTGKVINQVGGR